MSTVVRHIGEARAEQPLARFCSHCGHAPAQPAASTGVCPGYQLGLLFEAQREIAPGDHEAFLVVEASLTVCGMSAAAEELLGVDETLAVNRHLTDFLVPADASA